MTNSPSLSTRIVKNQKGDNLESENTLVLYEGAESDNAVQLYSEENISPEFSPPAGERKFIFPPRFAESIANQLILDTDMDYASDGPQKSDSSESETQIQNPYALTLGRNSPGVETRGQKAKKGLFSNVFSDSATSFSSLTGNTTPSRQILAPLTQPGGGRH